LFPQQYAEFLQKDNCTILSEYVQINIRKIRKLNQHVCVTSSVKLLQMTGNISLCLCLK